MNYSIDDKRRNESETSLGTALLEATEQLKVAGVPEPRREAVSLLTHALGKDRTFVISNRDEVIDPQVLSTFKSFIKRRASGEPQQYITEFQDFFGLSFRVTPDVLIPRPETELLVEAALNLIDKDQPVSICDIGTGSGCIAISMLYSVPKARAVAIDISKAALRIAQVNAELHHVQDRMLFLLSDAFSALDQDAAKFDLILSNPPYVSASSLAGLQKEVRDHEPLIALSPGGDGLSIIRSLTVQASTYLKEGGYLLFEIGFDQGDAVREMIDLNTWRLFDVQPDLQGIPRIVALQKL